MKNKNDVRRLTLLALATAMTMALSACSTTTQDDENDPWESVNRGIFGFNQVADEYVMEPVAKGYRYITPDPVISRIGNISDNLGEPVSMINAFLQGDFDQGMVNFWRFVLNSTVGIAGMNDVAASAGLMPRTEDFGQTLAVWGVGDGPYVMLPILGPSSVRDTGGMAADWFLNPVHYAIDDTGTEIWLAVAQGLVTRERLIEVLDDVNETSLDPYVTLRSMYRQHRAAQIANTGDGPLPSTGDSEIE